MTLRCIEQGWEAIAVPDGRRGLWIRVSRESGSLEICAGREGDDAYVVLRTGTKVTAEKLNNLLDCLLHLRDGTELASEG